MEMREREKVRTSKFSLEFYNYFMALDQRSIINYLFGLVGAKLPGKEREGKTEKWGKKTLVEKR